MTSHESPLFEVGQCVITTGAHDLFSEHKLDPCIYIRQHQTGDWNELTRADQEENIRAIETGARILSAFAVAKHRVLIITEAGRKSTTVLLAAEY